MCGRLFDSVMDPVTVAKFPLSDMLHIVIQPSIPSLYPFSLRQFYKFLTIYEWCTILLEDV